MKDNNLTKEEMQIFNKILGFTTKLEEHIKNNKKTKDSLTINTVINMPTYEFATLALNNDSPFQVIKAIQKIRKRYSLNLFFDQETLGFLDNIEGKAYGYIALRLANLENQEKFFKLAESYFKKSISRGYIYSELDLSDLYLKFKTIDEARALLKEKDNVFAEVNTKLGDMFYGFSELTFNAVRVIEGKRPYIEDIDSFRMANYNYSKGIERSINCKVRNALWRIIDKNSDTSAALKTLEANFARFKEWNSDIDKILFNSDAKIFKENVELIENKILKRNIK